MREEKRTIVTLTDEEIKANPFPDFYDLIAEKLGNANPKDIPNIKYDCRKICWSNYIQEQTIEWYKKQGVDTTEVFMILAMSAPKVCEKLKDNEVVVEDGFITFEKMKFKINVRETLEKVVEVEAENIYKAMDKVEDMCNSGDIVLDAEDFVGREVDKYEE